MNKSRAKNSNKTVTLSDSLLLRIAFFTSSFGTIVVIPSVSGTTIPSVSIILFGLGSLIFGKFRMLFSHSYLFVAIGLLVFLQSMSQIVEYFESSRSNVIEAELILVNFDSPTISLLTQLIYLIVGIYFFTIVRNSEARRLFEIALYGAATNAAIGILEFGIFFLSGNTLQIFSNRVFSNGLGLTNPDNVQTLILGGNVLRRVDGLSLEPSIFAFSTLGFTFVALAINKRKIFWLLILANFLTFSTTSIIGLSLAFLLLIRGRKFSESLLVVIFSTLLAGSVLWLYGGLGNAIDELFIRKITRVSYSGFDRFTTIEENLHFFSEMSLPEKFFGVGFGFIRAPDLFSTLLVNSGLLGLFCFIIFFLREAYVAFKQDVLKGCIVLFIAASFLISVSEFGISSIWICLGYAHNRFSNYPGHSKGMQANGL